MSWVIPPIEILAKWPPPNYDDPENLNGYMLGIEISALGVVFLVVGLRFSVRRFMVQNGHLKLDDWLIFVATMFATAMTAITIHALQFGWAVHIWDTKPENWSMLIKV